MTIRQWNNLNHNGNSIIQIIIAAGAASVLALALSGLLINQNKEALAISEKLLKEKNREEPPTTRTGDCIPFQFAQAN